MPTLATRLDTLIERVPCDTAPVRAWRSWANDMINLCTDAVNASERGWTQAEEWKRSSIKHSTKVKEIHKDLIVEVAAARGAFDAINELVKLAGARFDTTEWFKKYGCSEEG